MLTTMMDTNVKQCIICSTTTSVVLAVLSKLLFVSFVKGTITFRSVFSNVASDKSEWNTSSFKRYSIKG